jgi:hypothetical protein
LGLGVTSPDILKGTTKLLFELATASKAKASLYGELLVKIQGFPSFGSGTEIGFDVWKYQKSEKSDVCAYDSFSCS